MEIDDILLVKYVSSETDASEIETVERWRNESPENALLLRKIEAYWKAGVSPSAERKGGYAMLCGKIAAVQRRKNALSVLNIAASLFVGVLIGYSLLPHTGNREIVCMSGSGVSSVVLPDSTEVFLNRNSSISYREDFGKKTRRVVMEGECFFDVRKDASKRFEVETGGLMATVLGTEFGVRNRKGENSVSVALLSGSVSVKADDQKITLSPGKMVSYDKKSGEVSVELFDSDVSLAWKDNKIRYKSENIRDVIQKAARDKGVRVNIANEVFTASDIVSGTLESTQSFEQMLSILSAQVGFRWIKEDGSYYIMKNN